MQVVLFSLLPSPKGARILCQSVLIVVIFQERRRRNAFVKCVPVQLIFTGQQRRRNGRCIYHQSLLWDNRTQLSLPLHKVGTGWMHHLVVMMTAGQPAGRSVSQLRGSCTNHACTKPHNCNSSHFDDVPLVLFFVFVSFFLPVQVSTLRTSGRV